MHSTFTTPDPEFSAEPDLLVWIPRERGRTIWRVCIFGLSLVVFLAGGLILLSDLVRHGGMTTTQRVFVLALAVMCFANSLIKVVFIWFSLKLPLEISKLGMTIRGVTMSWDAVDDCRWARYSPDTLEVRTPHFRDYLPIPRNCRAAVEAALRKVGKWQS